MPSRLRKRPLETGAETIAHAGEIDIVSCATIAYSSEHLAHPAEHMLDGRSGPGAKRWISARPDTVEHIVVEFDQPQTISRLVYEVEEAMRERTQEVRVEVSEDGGGAYRQILVQEYTFSPRGATYQREELRPSISIRSAISVLRSFPTRVGPAPPRLRRSVSLFRHMHHVSLPLWPYPQRLSVAGLSTFGPNLLGITLVGHRQRTRVRVVTQLKFAELCSRRT